MPGHFQINDNTWLAPAKLNLFLHIVGRREDGYHLLQTVFQLLDYGDTLEFNTNKTGELTLQPSLSGVSDDDNLILRAAKLLQRKTGTLLGAGISIDKLLPMGGGLGGGSSNAATTLTALNILWNTKVSQCELAQLGARLGADVPVFVWGKSAWAEGIGEKLQPISLPARWFVVVNPGVHISTAELFSHPRLTRDSATITIRGFHSGKGLSNAFQLLVVEQYPAVKTALDGLSLVAHKCEVKNSQGEVRKPLLTGTGACVFLACDSQSQAQNVLAALPADTSAFIGRGC